MMILKKYLLFSTTTMFLFSCQNAGDNKQIGQMIGAAVGAVIGSNYGTGNNNKIYTILGSAGGFLLGGKLAHLLNQNEKDELNSVIEKSLEENPNNVSSNWSSQSNESISATVTPKSNIKINGNTCREFEKIIIKEENRYEKNAKACRDDNGNWKILDS